MPDMSPTNNFPLEELSLNHWPALSTLFYDGWALRFADGFTKRANSISPLYGSSYKLSDKMEYCRNIYTLHKLPVIYKITPFIRPAELDSALSDSGYAFADLSSVQTRSLLHVRDPEMREVRTSAEATEEWMAHNFQFSSADPRLAPVMRRMLANIRTATCFITLYCDGHPVSSGMAVIERGYVGLYDIVTDAAYRNRGFAEQLILHLLRWAQANGASAAYLAVVAHNVPALRLYAKLGFSEVYTYWYRILPPQHTS